MPMVKGLGGTEALVSGTLFCFEVNSIQGTVFNFGETCPGRNGVPAEVPKVARQSPSRLDADSRGA